ncbi:methylmalonyl-CoA epimerase [bacterium]|nr:methylmalonyl-CoA epimerase [bacterium]MCB2179313.1 methylmalonyl-CoA epimerase [bacterium]
MTKINHIAILVEQIEEALPFWQDALGLPFSHIEEVPAENARVAFLPVGESEIELVQPTDPATGLGRYLAKNGGGLHHICLEVPDIAAAMERLEAHGVSLINETPRQREDGTRYAFVHPKSTRGVLLELYQLP